MEAKKTGGRTPGKRTEKGEARYLWYALSWVLLVAFLALWQYSAQHRWVNPTIVSRPSKIWDRFVTMVSNGSLFNHIGSSLGRVVQGFLIGGAAGLLLGLLMGLSPWFEAVSSLFVSLLRPIPPIAWIPILILAMGIGEESKVAVISIGSFWPMLLDTINGVRSVDKQLLELGDVLEKDRKTKILRLVLPSAIPSIFTGARQAISRAWSCVVTAEMIAASSGVGFLIQYGRELSQPPLMFVGVTVIGLIGLAIDLLTSRLEKRLLYWNR